MNDPDHILCDPRFRKEQLLLEAAWRFQLVAPLLSHELDPAAKSRHRQHLTSHSHEHPFRGQVKVSARSVRRWCRSYRAQRLDGLVLQPRHDLGQSRALSSEALEQAKRLFREDSRRSVPALIRLLTQLNPSWAEIRRTTLGRHLRAAGLRRSAADAQSYTKFEAGAANALWQGDVLHGPKVLVGERLVTAKVVSWLDDHSRFVVHLQAFENERLPVLERTLTQAIAKHGRPDALLVDNGSIYSSHAFTLACSQLGIRKIHATAYHPETKGKQERFFRTLREQLLNEVENVEPCTLERLNSLLRSWLDVYHQALHSQTKETPQARYAEAAMTPVSRELLEEAFLQWTTRKVSVQGVVEFGGQKYHVDPSLAEMKVLVRYNPFDLSRIWLWKDCHKLCAATPETLLHRTLPRKGDKPRPSSSTASSLYLDELERAGRRRLEAQLNLMRLEDPRG